MHIRLAMILLKQISIELKVNPDEVVVSEFIATIK
jgi:hypothetical protein